MLKGLFHCSVRLRRGLPKSPYCRTMVLGLSWLISHPLVSRFRSNDNSHNQAPHLGQTPQPPGSSLAFRCFPRDWQCFRLPPRYKRFKRGNGHLHLCQNLCRNRHEQRSPRPDQSQNWRLSLDSSPGLREHNLLLPKLPSYRAPSKLLSHDADTQEEGQS